MLQKVCVIRTHQLRSALFYLKVIRVHPGVKVVATLGATATCFVPGEMACRPVCNCMLK